MITGEITSPVKIFNSDTKVSEVSGYFAASPEELGAVIVTEDKPVGLVMKEKLNQELAQPFGTALFLSKSIQKLMDNKPLIVERETPIDILAQIAISREHRQLYDFIIVIDSGGLVGTVSIKDILDFMTNVKMDMVLQANPLSGLPGNTPTCKEDLSRNDKTF
jgi:predicted transcriptional regulator